MRDELKFYENLDVILRNVFTMTGSDEIKRHYSSERFQITLRIDKNKNYIFVRIYKVITKGKLKIFF